MNFAKIGLCQVGISSFHALILCIVRPFLDWLHRKGGKKSAWLSHSQMGESICAVGI